MARKKPDPAYLYYPKDMILADADGYFFDCLVFNAGLSKERAQEIVDILANKGVHRYDQLLDKLCSIEWLTKEIPRIEPKAVEMIQHFFVFGEKKNKTMLVEKYQEAQEEITRLKQQPTKQLDKAAVDGREIAKSM